MQKLGIQKGITLIALIITIIVMLILVGVTVSVSLNGGLFEKTKQAGNEMQREVDRETLYDLVLASIGNDGKVDFTVLDGKVEGTAGLFTKIADKKYQSKKGNTFTLGDYGQITYEEESGAGVILTWTHADVNSNETFDVGEVVTASNGESFYVIETPAADAQTVKLLAAKCVDTRAQINGETNPNYNKQNDTYNEVAFDEGAWDTWHQNCYKPGTTTPVTNVYANASIKELVEAYVSETLGLNANQGMLMSYDEATALQSGGHTDILYGTEWLYWTGTPIQDNSYKAWYVSGRRFVSGSIVIEPDIMGQDVVGECGLRPVIDISLSNIG